MFKRKISDTLYHGLLKDQGIILIGSRQVGKTTLLLELERRLKSDGIKTSYHNLELPGDMDKFSHGVEAYIDNLHTQGVDIKRAEGKERLYILIDEFHYIPGAGHFLKAIFDVFPGIQVIATGSSSPEIQKSLKESLVGRKLIKKVYPLDFTEFLYFKSSGQETLEEIALHKPHSEVKRQRLVKAFDEFLLWGGMPRCVLENDMEERRTQLEEIVGSYLQKDIKGLLGIERVAHFNNLLKLLASQTGNLLNLEEVSNTLRTPRNRIENELFILENTFVNYKVPPLFSNKRKEVSHAHKTFFYDNGIRNQILNNFAPLTERPDAGAIIENAVFNELLKNIKPSEQLYFWRTLHQTEIDFILHKDGNYIPVEVKKARAGTIPPAVKSFLNEYPSQAGVVLNRDIWKCERYEKKPVYFLPLYTAGFLPSILLADSTHSSQKP